MEQIQLECSCVTIMPTTKQVRIHESCIPGTLQDKQESPHIRKSCHIVRQSLLLYVSCFQQAQDGSSCNVSFSLPRPEKLVYISGLMIFFLLPGRNYQFGRNYYRLVSTFSSAFIDVEGRKEYWTKGKVILTCRNLWEV